MPRRGNLINFFVARFYIKRKILEMKLLKNNSLKSFFFIIIILLTFSFSACSPQSQLNSLDPLPTAQRTAESTPTPFPTLPPIDQMTLTFEEGKYIRDNFCARVFDYHKTDYAKLSIIIADNLVEEMEQEQLAKKVISLYRQVYETAPGFLNFQVNIFILPDPDIGECYSRDNLVFIAPDQLDSRTFFENFLGAAAGTNEYWIKTGLTSLVLGEQPDTEALRTWYEKTDDLDMAGLFIARFNEDWASEEEQKIARMSAASLVRYALDVENIQLDMLEEQITNNERTRWLESLEVYRTVTYPYDGSFSGFLYSQSNECQLIVNTDTMHFCLNRIHNQEYFDEISEVEFFIFDAYYGRKYLVDYIMSEAPSVSHLISPEETIEFEVRDLGGRLGYTNGNKISLNKSSTYYDILHEVVHTFEWNSSMNYGDKIWICEGFAEYLGTLLTIYPQTAKRCVYEDLTGPLNTEETSAPGTSHWYFLDPEQFSAAKAWYLAQGGKMENKESIDPQLYVDAVSFATIYRDAHGGARGISIGEKYDLLIPGFHNEGQDGMELSYTQAASLVAWLCDTYSIDRVLDVYVNHAEDGKLDGKTYEELKTAWQASLISKGEGIEIPIAVP